MFKKASFFEEMFKGIHKGHGNGKRGRKPAKSKDIDNDDQPSE